jgi:hypothetical protein
MVSGTPVFVGIFNDERNPMTNLPPSFPGRLIFSRTVVPAKPSFSTGFLFLLKCPKIGSNSR